MCFVHMYGYACSWLCDRAIDSLYKQFHGTAAARQRSAVFALHCDV